MPGLADFLAALDSRLHGLGPEGVSIALRGAAGRLSPSERPAFLAMFDPAPAASADGLVAEIEALSPAVLTQRTTSRIHAGSGATGTTAGKKTRSHGSPARRTTFTESSANGSSPAIGPSQRTGTDNCCLRRWRMSTHRMDVSLVVPTRARRSVGPVRALPPRSRVGAGSATGRVRCRSA